MSGLCKIHQLKDISTEQVQQACRTAARTDQNTIDALVAITGKPYKLCWKKLEQMDGKGLVSYGVSIKYAWWQGP